MNISERARWVACLLGRTRGHGRQDIIPSGRRINNTFDVSDGDVPAAGPLGRSGKNKGICSFFFSLCSPCSHGTQYKLVGTCHREWPAGAAGGGRLYGLAPPAAERPRRGGPSEDRDLQCEKIASFPGQRLAGLNLGLALPKEVLKT